ncbi:uncharacterized protein LOC102576767 [Alligator mississippiensis]|uniref:uncharacterized protein LOC102576767 n=1 Tax=Alligator mississippiensis TaxID=8496 RepID=UPI00287783A6|nr:uncharacterized protein LOC102576767 [Alligator mississippiensis]
MDLTVLGTSPAGKFLWMPHQALPAYVLRPSWLQPKTLHCISSWGFRASQLAWPRGLHSFQGSWTHGLVEIPSKMAFLSEKDFQKRSGKEMQWEQEEELRKEIGIFKDMRVCLQRLNPIWPKENSGNVSGLGQSRRRELLRVSKKGLQKRSGKEMQWEQEEVSRKKCGILKDVRVCLRRMNPIESKENSGKATALGKVATTRKE